MPRSLEAGHDRCHGTAPSAIDRPGISPSRWRFGATRKTPRDSPQRPAGDAYADRAVVPPRRTNSGSRIACASLARIAGAARHNAEKHCAVARPARNLLVSAGGVDAARTIGLVGPSPCSFAQIPCVGSVQMACAVPDRTGGIDRAIMAVAALRRARRLARGDLDRCPRRRGDGCHHVRRGHRRRRLAIRIVPEYDRPKLKHRQHHAGADHPLAHPCPPRHAPA